MLRSAFLPLLSLLPLLSHAARLPPSSFLLEEINSETFPAGLKHVHSPIKTIRAAKKMEREDWTEKTAYATIKFTVPPSKSDDFEEAWMRLESEVRDKEGDNSILNLKSSSLDNLFYYSYGEWESVDSFVDHLESNHFQDFAEAADEAGILWNLVWLDNLSEDIERKERGREDERNRGRGRREEEEEDRAYILVTYYVPPGNAEDFVEKWREEAKSTIKEEGNRVQSLTSNKNDNLRFYAYSSWDSLDDYFEHTKSKHHNSLQDFLEDRDIVRVVQPLEPVRKESERRQE